MLVKIDVMHAVYSEQWYIQGVPIKKQTLWANAADFETEFTLFGIGGFRLYMQQISLQFDKGNFKV